MLNLTKSHDPRKNEALLGQITGKQLDMKEALQETERLFQECLAKTPEPVLVKKQKYPIPFTQKAGELLFRPFSKPAILPEPCKLYVDSKGNVYPDWLDKLNREFLQLEKMVIKEVNVADYGAVGDGRTDCTAAFNKAIGKGKVKVVVPKGVFITHGIQLPSWTWLSGTGKGTTTLKLHSDADKGTRQITNASHWRGNHHIIVEGLSLDWNVERLGNDSKTSTWGNHSSCLTFANVTYGWIRDVEAINPGLHGIDISSTLYNYAGDGRRARGGSKYVWVDNVTSCGFGDDGITTHHSDYILISHSHLCDPSGRAHRKGFSNSNGIEIDDGSQNVVLVNNSTARCFGGVEIKAHQNSSAASNIQIAGHLSVNDNRSFNFRHIGHHKLEDPESKTAFNIMATNLVSIGPVCTNLYKDSKPRGLVVSSYKNVVINHFTAIGEPHYNYAGGPVAAIQYRARNVILNQLFFKNFTTAESGIKVFGGPNRADSVCIQNVEAADSNFQIISTGSGLKDVKMKTIKPTREAVLPRR
ncbi:glycoside hydrolase family 55 protein [Neobacillus mesonae]|uniref:glycoside hydrolase family 55 protein n=1 Tax=Neobacillus mesonae TaxID=1193713 RepID=UPI00203E3EC9|nr:glycoside hydrolase family 55 protein [Neobacillus mesonae]MCM3569744.1 glycoside hydrolase family 55 protein [Neobacillus mesonae]